MKRKLTPLAISLCLLGIAAHPAYAAAATTQNSALEKKINLLQNELDDLKTQVKPNPAPHTVTHHSSRPARLKNTHPNQTNIGQTTPSASSLSSSGDSKA